MYNKYNLDNNLGGFINLQKIKELENLKEELRKYRSEYEKLSNERRHNYIIGRKSAINKI